VNAVSRETTEIPGSARAAPMQVYALKIEEISGISGPVETQIVVEARRSLMSPRAGFIMQISW
jgi:hypothetical protein